MSPTVIKTLFVEDSAAQAVLLEKMLAISSTTKFETYRVECLSDAFNQLELAKYDVTILDLGLPDSQGLDTLIRLHGKFPDLPIVILTGLDQDQIGIEAIQHGAQDFLTKGEFSSALLTRVLRFAVERMRLQRRLQEVRAELKTLSGLLPICAWCNKIRNDNGYWSQLESYLQENARMHFSHSICPECLDQQSE